jgi:ribosomal protein L11 methyltransferase
MAAKLYLVAASLPGPPGEELQVFLAEHVSWGWEELEEEDQTVLHIYCSSLEQAEALSARIAAGFPDLEAHIAQLDDQDWAEAWRSFFQPIRIAKTFAVVPSWEEPAACAPDLHRIAIYPQMAFGTGHHPTTHLCLEVLAELWIKGALGSRQKCLDLGTGSGILGIAASLLGLRTLGLDTDPVAVDNAKLNRSLNRVETRLGLIVGGVECLRAARGFDLIVANILAEPLKDLAEGILARLAPQGRLLLSGILCSQEPEVAKAYARHGLGEPAVYRRQDWSALLWQVA